MVFYDRLCYEARHGDWDVDGSDPNISAHFGSGSNGVDESLWALAAQWDQALWALVSERDKATATFTSENTARNVVTLDPRLGNLPHSPRDSSTGLRSSTTAGDYDHEPLQTPGKPKEKRVKPPPLVWTQDMTAVLIEVMLKETRHGARAGNGWKTVTYNLAVTVVEPKANEGQALRYITVNGQQCKDKIGNLKSNYEVWKHLHSISGWGWDELRQLIEAPHELAWEREIAKSKLARAFKTKPLLHRMQLEELFEGITANGQYALYTTMPRMKTPPPGPTLVESEVSACNPNTPESSGVVGINFRKRAKPDTSTSGTLRLSIAVETLAKAEIVTKMAVRKLNQEYTVGDLLSKRQMLQAFRLFENRSKAEVFLALGEGELRDEWLEEEIADAEAARVRV